MEWNTAEVGGGEQQGRNCGSQVNCSDTNRLFFPICSSQTTHYWARSTVHGFPCFCPNYMEWGLNKILCVRLSLLHSMQIRFPLPWYMNWIVMEGEDGLFMHSSHVSFRLVLGDVNMRTTSQNGRMSLDSYHHDKGAKGLDLWVRIEQPNRVAKSGPNSIQ